MSAGNEFMPQLFVWKAVCLFHFHVESYVCKVLSWELFSFRNVCLLNYLVCDIIVAFVPLCVMCFWAFWICDLMYFIIFWKVLAINSSNISSAFFSLSWDSSYTFVEQFGIAPRLRCPVSFHSFFYLCFSLANFYLSGFKFTDFYASMSGLLMNLSKDVLISFIFFTSSISIWPLQFSCLLNSTSDNIGYPPFPLKPLM